MRLVIHNHFTRDEVDMTLYHGTAQSHLHGIGKEGIKPKGGEGGDLWAVQKHMALANPKYTRDPAVFLTDNKGTAGMFAKIASQVTKSRPVVLKVDVPDKELKKLKPDERFDASYMGKQDKYVAVKYPGVIPRKWIIGANRHPNTNVYSQVFDAAATLVIKVKYEKGPYGTSMKREAEYRVPFSTSLRATPEYVSSKLRQQPGHKELLLAGWQAATVEGHVE